MKDMSHVCAMIIGYLLKITSTTSKDVVRSYITQIRSLMKELDALLRESDIKRVIIDMRASWGSIYKEGIKIYRGEMAGSTAIPKSPAKCPWRFSDFIIGNNWNDARIDSEIHELLFMAKPKTKSFIYPWYK